MCKISGKKVFQAFALEKGGLRWQRIPPTEKKGRVHTSTITVAILEKNKSKEVIISNDDLEFKTTRGSGAGGQHRNVTDSAVQLTHKPTGIQIRCESGRSQHDNKRQAMELLKLKLSNLESAKSNSSRNKARKNQIGSGMRGDKVRTIRLQDDLVVDHISGKRTTAKRYLKGRLEDLY